MNEAEARGFGGPKNVVSARDSEASRPILLRAEGLWKSFYDGGREVQVLKGLELEIAAGERVAVVGHSGVGKSTLLHILGSLDRPSAGRIAFDSQDLFSLTPRELARFRNRELGFVFQFHYLLADFSAAENVAMPALIARFAPREARDLARQALELVGLAEKAHRRPAELSGGEQQLVAVARALVLRPRLVLADEPTGNLDPLTALELSQLLARLNEELGVTMVVATHNERLAREMNRILVLKDGVLAQEARG